MSIPVAGTLLEGCVLSFLLEADEYGYNLTQRTKAMLDVSESTLYPVMRRLQTDACLSAYDVAYNGRNRRYYQITQRGRERHALCKQSWQAHKKRIDEILLRGEEE